MDVNRAARSAGLPQGSDRASPSFRQAVPAQAVRLQAVGHLDVPPFELKAGRLGLEQQQGGESSPHTMADQACTS